MWQRARATSKEHGSMPPAMPMQPPAMSHPMPFILHFKVLERLLSRLCFKVLYVVANHANHGQNDGDRLEPGTSHPNLRFFLFSFLNFITPGRDSHSFFSSQERIHGRLPQTEDTQGKEKTLINHRKIVAFTYFA